MKFSTTFALFAATMALVSDPVLATGKGKGSSSKSSGKGGSGSGSKSGKGSGKGSKSSGKGGGKGGSSSSDDAPAPERDSGSSSGSSKSGGSGKGDSGKGSKSGSNSAGSKSGSKSGSGSKSSSSSSSDDGPETMTLMITSLAVRQPFGPFFVMTHSKQAEPLFQYGKPASDALAILAEDGNPGDLLSLYNGMDGVGSVFAFDEGFPFMGGAMFTIEVPRDSDNPYISLASMAINTNDAFVAINGEKLRRGDVLHLPGLDAGSEVNNELCNSIPGPACANIDTANVRSGDGEGFVHVHPGFHGIGDLAENRYDWRNPMLRVEVL